jgi:hypothetical protein
MATNPSVGMDATTSPPLWADELRQIGHDHLGAGRVAQMWQPIVEFWRRQVAGIDPSSSRAAMTLADPCEAPSLPERLGRSHFRPTRSPAWASSRP